MAKQEGTMARIQQLFSRESSGLDLPAGFDPQKTLPFTSMDLVQAAVLLEKEFGFRFSLAEITEENFGTLEKITALVQRKTS